MRTKKGAHFTICFLMNFPTFWTQKSISANWVMLNVSRDIVFYFNGDSSMLRYSWCFKEGIVFCILEMDVNILWYYITKLYMEWIRCSSNKSEMWQYTLTWKFEIYFTVDISVNGLANYRWVIGCHWNFVIFLDNLLAIGDVFWKANGFPLKILFNIF